MLPVWGMTKGIEEIIRIATEEFRKLFPESKVTEVEVEEVEEITASGNYLVTLGYWKKDSKPAPADALLSRKVISSISLSPDLLHPWRRKYKRVEVDPAQGKVVAIRMYEPPLGVS